jgi:hypothetical protein
MFIEVAIILGLAAIAGTAAVVIYWTKIVNWARNSLMPWIDKNIPELSEFVRDAFVMIDKVAAPIRDLAKTAWQRVRQTLLHQVAEFEQRTQNTWLLRITSWVKVKLDALDPEPVVKQVQTEQIISYDELPPQVREQLLREGKTTHRIDVTEARDKEIELAMSA